MAYRGELDGLRAFAAFAVLFFHTGVPIFAGGGRGVDVFFVLSGYLITGLLAEERSRKGAINLAHFWWRRIKRLVPALYLLLAAFLLLAPTVAPAYSADRFTDALLSATYLSNYALAQAPRFSLLAHTWSLSAEMQFYVLWPLALPLLLRLPREWAVRVLLLAWGVMTLWRTVHAMSGDTWESAYYPLHFHSTGLLLGCAVALNRQEAASLIGWIAAAALLVLSCIGDADLLWTIAASEVCAAVLIASLGAGSIQRTFARGPLPLLGKLSYGVYLWHAPIAVLTSEWSWWVRMPFVAVASTALAALSYYTVERWVREGVQFRPSASPPASSSGSSIAP